jgi:1-acyl-sn-glycerol-3-phosphate acyltransferase
MMKVIKDIFGRLLALWALVFFGVTMIIVVIPIWLTNFMKEPRGTEVFRRISKAWMDIFLWVLGSPIKVKGGEHFKKGETYIVVCNHKSMMDVPLSTPHIPGPNKTIAKKELASIPIFGLIYKRGSILVDRKSDESRRKSLEEMKTVLETGMHMCIYPEGTRNKTGNPLKSFYDGAFRLASDTGHSIIPALIFNTEKVLPSNRRFYVWPNRVAIHFLPPVPVTRGQNVPELRDQVFKIMWDYYETHKSSRDKKHRTAEKIS